MKTALQLFVDDIRTRIAQYRKKGGILEQGAKMSNSMSLHKYPYNFFWMGVPIIQFPQDIQAMQEIIWETKPEIIIETGVAWGGSVLFSASILSLLEICQEIRDAKVIGIDVEIRPHNRTTIESHPLAKKIVLVEDSSISPAVIQHLHTLVKGKRVMVCLDSNHTHEHVLEELKLYTPFVSKGCYCMVADTIIENLPAEAIPDRPWGRGNSPLTAINQFLRTTDEFVVDSEIEHKLLFSCTPGGFLKRVV